MHVVEIDVPRQAGPNDAAGGREAQRLDHFDRVVVSVPHGDLLCRQRFGGFRRRDAFDREGRGGGTPGHARRAVDLYATDGLQSGQQRLEHSGLGCGNLIHSFFQQEPRGRLDAGDALEVRHAGFDATRPGVGCGANLEHRQRVE